MCGGRLEQVESFKTQRLEETQVPKEEVKSTTDGKGEVGEWPQGLGHRSSSEPVEFFTQQGEHGGGGYGDLSWVCGGGGQ